MCVKPILFHHPQDESAQQLMNVLMDTLMGSNGHLVGFFMFFSHRTLISWRSPFQKVACSIRTSWIFLRHGLVPWVNMGYGIVIQNSEHDWTPKVSYTGYRKNTYLMDWWPPKNHAIMASWHISNLIVASPPSKWRLNTSQTNRTYALIKLHDFTSLLKTNYSYVLY